MSRKTEEIKIRVTAEEKAAWQEQAVSEDTTVSELIRREMNQRHTLPVFPTEPQVHRKPPAATTEWPYGDPIPITTAECSWPSGADDETPLPVASPQEDVTTSDEVGAKEERRTEPCACGKPSWLYCGSCDV